MKFLAILKDSLREAIDAKVFYVMVGLSVLATLLTFSVTLTPETGGSQVIREYAMLPLNGDASELGQAEVMNVFFQARPVRFDVESVEPLDGAADVLTSTYKVKLKASFNTREAAQKAKADPQATETFIRDQFGQIEGARMMEAAQVHFTGWEGDIPFMGGVFGGGLKGNFEMEARPTPVTFRFWPHKCSLLFGLLPLGQPFWPTTAPLHEHVYLIENVLVGYIGSTIAVLISIVITAFFIPNMLRKGTIDLLLAKPLTRVGLLLYKFVGGLTFIFLNTAVAVFGVWLALSLRSGIWAFSFLETILVLTFFFAILYAVSTMFGVLTRSPIACILLTVAVWFFLFLVGALNDWLFETMRAMDRTAHAIHEKLGDEGVKALEEAQDQAGDQPGGPRGRGPRLEEFHFEENWFSRTIYVLHAMLPRTTDLYLLMSRQLRHELAFGEFWPPHQGDKPPPELPGGIPLPQVAPKPPTLTEVLGISGAFIAVMLGVACFWFATKDY